MTISYIHLRNGDSHFGGSTIAYYCATLADGTTRIHYAVAHCSLRDRYTRAIGRSVAGGRLHSGLCETFVKHPDHRIIEAILTREGVSHAILR